MNKENIYTVLLLILLVCLAGFATWYVSQKNEAAKIEKSPASQALMGNADVKFTYTDIEGNLVSLSKYITKVTVVNSWASWSPASADELTLLSSVSSDYSESEVNFLAVNRAEPGSTAQRFLNKHNIEDKIVLLLDKEDAYYKSIGGYAMPETIVYNREGEVVKHFRGPFTREEIISAIELAQIQN